MVRVPIDRDALRWAREAMGLEIDEAAHALAVKADTLAKWEAGELEPTLVQLRNIASRYDQNTAFFLGPPPEKSDVPELIDFRGAADSRVPAEVRRELKRADEHRSAVLDLDGQPGGGLLELPRISWRNLAESAAVVRRTFGATVRGATPNDRFNAWRRVFDEHGILVFQTTKISLRQYRGLSVHHDVYPIVVVNGGDAANGKIFTLFHELAHLANRSSAMCLEREDGGGESLCNAFAAEFLMPAAEVRRLVGQQLIAPNPASLAEHFHVSKLAAAVRLRVLEYLTEESLQDFWEAETREWEEARADARLANKKGPPPWRLRYRDLGPRYVSTVVRAVDRQQIDIVDASYLLNARLPMVNEMIRESRRQGES